MAYSYKNSKGQTYYLYNKDVTLKGGRIQRIYFFSKEENNEGSLEEVPQGFKVIENKKTGLPLLKKEEKK
ncbi:MAG: hypothetical protein UR27_C0013G0034 [Candidatus Peregrinibacteria bacterium GW2011_GWA2_33_10]|nr:MAG: hypothetical protein UR27_C0013G0034 [Candidatus Peregrinibacteria bacterium GW2011_GWA2_33_10]KKP39166.1 MAG: hypothetical protein UR30_C0012G0039 [Candidatus Peregrinibacteria bacterium GW2011_GWC2_33_13]